MAMRLATDIFDFYPDSPDYSQMNYEGAANESSNRVADRNNELLLKKAELDAKISAMQTASRIQQMSDASSAGLRNDLISGALSLGGSVVTAGAGAGWFDKAPSSGTIGLGDGFNIGEGQAGLDTGVDLDRWLQTPTGSIAT